MPREKHYWYMKELKAIHVYTKSPLPPQKSISPSPRTQTKLGNYSLVLVSKPKD